MKKKQKVFWAIRHSTEVNPNAKRGQIIRWSEKAALEIYEASVGFRRHGIRLYKVKNGIAKDVTPKTKEGK